MSTKGIGMYCVVYEFKVKSGKTLEFEKSWGDFTEAIYRVCGSLGSRLHKTDDLHTYIAYAQWPTREVFETKVSETAYNEEEANAQKLLMDSLESTKKLFLLNMIDDRLR